MLRALFALAVLATVGSAEAAPLSRWTSTSIEFAEEIKVAGRENPTLLLRRRASHDPLRSLDGGATWVPFRVDGEFASEVSASHLDSRTWFAGTVSRSYKTQDGGATWTALGSYNGGRVLVSDLKVGATPNLLYAHTSASVNGINTVLASRDGGSTWSEMLPPAVYAGYYDPSPADAGVVWMLARKDSRTVLYRTADGGVTWTIATPPGDAHPHIVADGADGRAAYVFSGPLGKALWHTSDGGVSWVELDMPVALPGHLVADPVQAGRAYLYDFREGVYETRDAGRSWTLVNPSGGPATPGVMRVVASGGTRFAISAWDKVVRRLDLAAGAVALGSDLWWNPAESGSGLTITQHASNRPFVVWYNYDATGAPVWRVVPGGTWNDRTFSGAMYETTGPAYFAGPFDASRVAARTVGTATLRFDDENNAVFAYSLGALAGEKHITRQLFAPPAASSIKSHADLWWNEAESGWGMAVSHQHNRIFATWYVYGEDGKPLWIVMPDAVISQEFVGAIVQPFASGDIYTTRGPAAGAPYDSAQVVPTRVGTAKLRLRGGRIDLEYTAFGRSDTRTLTRQPF